MANDPELAAMAALKKALDPLDAETRGHVLKWAFERFDVPPPAKLGKQDVDEASETGAGGSEISSYEELGDLWTAAAPSNDQDRVLVVSAWFQEARGNATIAGQQVNAELKNLGHGIANITRVFDALVATKPQLVLQTKKSGTARQARKSFKVTKVGLDRVRALIAGTAE